MLISMSLVRTTLIQCTCSDLFLGTISSVMGAFGSLHDDDAATLSVLGFRYTDPHNEPNAVVPDSPNRLIQQRLYFLLVLTHIIEKFNRRHHNL